MERSVRSCLGFLVVALGFCGAPGRVLEAQDGPAGGAGEGTGREVEIYDTQEPIAPFLSPAEALSALRLPEGFSATVFAAEPLVRQPIAMTFDGRGRLWVAENFTYSERQRNFDLRLHDRILILEDSDSDGRADRRKVFWNRAQRLTSVEIGFGGVWALAAPHLLFIPDEDGDGEPDGEPEVILDGWDADRVRHNFVNGLKWGPDGWLYGRHGILQTSWVGEPGTPRDQRTPINCGIWRLHPVDRRFEVVARGTTNPWGHDWNERGELFFINTVIGHLWHVVPGAHYERMYGEDFNPHLYELLPQTADHYHWDRREAWSEIRQTGTVSKTTSRAGGGHAHSGLMIYLGDNWPEEYRDDIFTVNFHGRRVNRDHVERRGASFVGKHRDDVLHSDDVWFRGIELVYGPDGGVYLSDWSDVGECHDSDGIHRSSGRIFKVVHDADTEGESAAAVTLADLATADAGTLADLLTHRNEWFSRQARRVLHERATRGDDLQSLADNLRERFVTSDDVASRLRYLWTLHQIGDANAAWLRGLLEDPDESIRSWAVRLLVDDGQPSAATVDRLVELAAREPSGLVQLYLASALQRLSHDARWPLATPLGRSDRFADDPVFPRMLWYGIEPAVVTHPDQAVQFAIQCRIPKLQRWIARRLTSAIESRGGEGVEALVAALGRDDNELRPLPILTGMAEALRGWRKAPPPPSWSGAAKRFARHEDPRLRQLARELSVVFGDGRALTEVRRQVEDPDAAIPARRQALQTLLQSEVDNLEPLLWRMLEVRDLAPTAVRGLGARRDEGTSKRLLSRYRALHNRGRAAVIDVLAARVDDAHALLDAIESGVIRPHEVTSFQIRRMRNLADPALRERLKRVWPRAFLLPAEKRELFDEFRGRLTEEELARADLRRGRELFKLTCAPCHKLFGEGEETAPDLTGANRKNLAYLLENLLDPSAEVAENYRVSIVTVRDGRVLNGVIGRQTDRTMTLTTPTEELTLERDAVVQIRSTESSLMPEGLLEALDFDQARDLIAFLMRGAPGGGESE